MIPAELAPPTPTPVPTECGFVYDYEPAHETDVIVSGADAAAECTGLSGHLPSGDWQLVMGKVYGSYRMCQGTIGASSIEVWDTAFSAPPVWTTTLCAEIQAGTLGR